MYIYPTESKLTYTPIAIQFVPSLILSGSAQPQESRGMNLIIHSPSSRCVGLQQTTRKIHTLAIPNNGVLSFVLAASSNYTPKGRYRCLFQYQGATEPFDEQYWVVPARPRLRTITVSTLGNLSGSSPLTYYPFGAITSSLGADLSYTLAGQEFVWSLSSMPPNGVFSITYQPCVTLDQLIDLTHKPKQ